VPHKHQAHDGHSHTPNPDADTRYLALTLGLILAFMAFEVAMAVVSHSLTLFADAGHMLTDAVAIGAAILAARLAMRPAHGSMTFGLKRAEILSAQGNGITLLVVAAVVAFEAIHRLIDPPVVRGPILLIVAGVGVAVNLVAVATLARANRQSLNIEGSYQHILTDLYAFIATFLAGGIIIATGFNRADPIASLVVVALMLKASYGLLKDTGRVLLEVAPGNVNVDGLAHDLAAQEDVREVHDVHLWEITSGFPALSAHVLVRPDADCHGIRRHLEKLLAERYDITHTTLQVDHVSDSSVSVQSLVSSGHAVQRRKKRASADPDLPPTAS
jgi:cobalt-zinc-cadmium efflux system protein